MTFRDPLAVALAALVIATPAVAQTWPVGSDQMHIVYPGLNVNTPAGRAALLGRVERAAAKLCDGLIATDRGPCIADTIDRATRGKAGPVLAMARAERRGAVRLAGR